MKRMLSLLIMLLLGLSALPAATGSAQAASWAEPYLNNLVTRAVMKGDPDGQLYPTRSVTRAEFAAMLNRAFGFSEPGSSKFRDVPATAWYASDISIAANQGYLQGDSKGANPMGNLTREEAAAMLCRALKIAPLAGEQFRLTDERGFANWSRGYINAAAEKGFVNGYPDGSFRPKNRITRGEAAKMLSEIAGEIRSASEQHRLGRTVSGNLTISSSSVTLSDVTVTGDLYITEGVGLGYVHLENVTVLGEVIISGAGESNIGASSIILTDCDIPRLTVDVAKRKILTLKTDGTTRVQEAIIKSSTYLEELSRHYEGFDRVVMDAPAKSFLNLRGSFGDVVLLGEGSVLGLYQGQINSITVDEAATKSTITLEKDTYVSSIYFDAGATVSGLGEIGSVLVNNDGAVIAQLPEYIYIRPGVTATIGGKKMSFLDAEMDSLSPAFMGDYPKVDLISPTGFTLLYMSNKPGKTYYGVYPASSPRPSLDELMAKTGTTKTALKQGTLNSLPDKEIKVAVSGLKAGTQYVVYSVFVDLRGESSSIHREYVNTVDNVIPTLLSGYPKVENIKATSASFVLIPNKDTSFYWAILPDKSIAPTVDQLYRQTVSGAVIQQVTSGGRQNERMDITLPNDTLTESLTYTFYVILGDSAGNLSKTAAKVNFTTKDMTAPTFITPDYPRIGVPAATAIPLEYMVDEPCTVYWMAAREGVNVLPGDTTKQPEAVKLGTGAYKNGKANAAKERTKYTLNLSGLEKEMSYDIYLVLEDKAGNVSGVTSLNSKTLDKTAPTATVSTPQPINGKFPLDRPITITFSEVVYAVHKSGEPQRLSELFNDAADKKILEHYIQLVYENPNTPAPQPQIDWTNVTVRDYNAKTEIIFPLAVTSALSLSNDVKYQFILGHSYPNTYLLQDSSKNLLAEKTLLKFETVPPLTSFYEEIDFPTKYHKAFSLHPQQQSTGDHIYFDIMLRSDHALTFDLYQDSSPGFKDAKLVKAGCSLPKDFAVPLSSYQTIGLYKDLETTYYAFVITNVNGTDIDESGSPITVNINLRMNAVIGNLQDLRSLSGAAKDLEGQIKSLSSVSDVTAPSAPFLLTPQLRDSIAPAMQGDANITAGDVQALIKLNTTKACTVYYWAIPTTDTSVSNPTVYQIMAARSDVTRGIAAGSFTSTDSVVTAEHTITGLLPNLEYRIFFFLQGQAPTPSIIYSKTFNTSSVTSPSNVERYYRADVNSAIVTSQWDMDCTVYYVVYQQSVPQPNANQIINPTQGSDLVDSGTFTAKKDRKEESIIRPLNEGTRYRIFMVAQRYIGTSPAGAPSDVVSIETIMAKDNTAPRISGGEATTDGRYYTASKSFGGKLTISFTEPLYYLDGNMIRPLTAKYFVDNITGTARSNLKRDTNEYDYTEDTIPVLDSTGQQMVDGSGNPVTEQCLRSITFEYEKIGQGASFEFAKTICDRANNESGILRVTFQVNDTNPDNPTGRWDAKFLK